MTKKAIVADPEPLVFEPGESLESFIERLNGEADPKVAEITAVFTLQEMRSVLDYIFTKIDSAKTVFSKILDDLRTEDNEGLIDSTALVFESVCEDIGGIIENDHRILQGVGCTKFTSRAVWRRDEPESRRAAQKEARAQLPAKLNISEAEAHLILERRKRYGIIA